MIKTNDFEIFKFNGNVYEDKIVNGEVFKVNSSTYLDIVLNDSCNRNCGFCIANLIHNKLTANLNIFKGKITYAINELNVKEVLLLGGEPTLYSNLIPLIKWLSEQKLDKVVMTTNGIKLFENYKFAEDVISSGLTNINISIMGEASQLKDARKHLPEIYKICKNNGVNLRVNSNIYLGSNDNIGSLVDSYNTVKNHCDSVKFSPLLMTDNFSVKNIITEWVKKNRVADEQVIDIFEGLLEDTEDLGFSVIDNNNQFGFVRNTLIPLKTPIILNWNVAKYSSMMSNCVDKKQINSIKLLPNNELSMSWNRELEEYFIKTK